MNRTTTPSRKARILGLTASVALVVTPLTAAAASTEGPTKQLGESESRSTTAPRPALAAGLIITYAPGASAATLDAVATSAGKPGARPVAINARSSAVPFDGLVDLDTAQELAEQVAALPGVVAVEPDLIVQAAAASPIQPNDPLFAQQHGVWDTRDSWVGQDDITRALPAGGYSVKAPALWRSTTGSPNVVVAVLDTGQTSHPDLDAGTVAGYDFISYPEISRDGNGRDANPRDEGDWVTYGQCDVDSPAEASSWHGMHVAGIVGARRNDSYGITGVAPTVRLQHVRVLGACGGANSDIIAAITWASGGSVPGVPKNATPAKVLNLSLGGPDVCSPATQAAIDGARARGSVVIVAAGNSASPTSYFTPANCQNVITVGATDPNGMYASYTNYGPELDVSAPGGDISGYGDLAYGIVSTIDAGTQGPAGPAHASYQGTSMAAPAVAGGAALIASLYQLNATQLEGAVRAAVQPFPKHNLPWDCTTALCGRGLFDLSTVPMPAAAPTLSGSARLGGTLTVASTWHGTPAVSYQWLRGSTAIPGATSTSYKVKAADIGSRIGVRVTVSKSGFPALPRTVTTSSVVPKIKTSIKAKLKKKKIKRKKKAKVVVRVKTPGIAKPVGKVKVKYGKKTKTVKLKGKHRGKVTVTLPRLKKGRYKVVVRFVPTGKKIVTAKKASTLKLRVR